MASTNNSIALVYVIWIGFLFFFGSMQLCLCFSGNRSKPGSCIEMERKALLSIREGILDAHKWLSWNGTDCCSWKGVQCDTMTDHVVKLDLRNPYDVPSIYHYRGNESQNKSEVSPSLLHLRHLNYLDLSMNDFGGASIPHFIGSLAKLEYLNLSHARFGGTIPHQLGNLSSLVYLDLYNYNVGEVYSALNPDEAFPLLNVDDLGWLSQIHFLRYLDMSYVNLLGASNWLHVINMLPSLSVLYLSHADLSSLPSTLPHVNFTSLTALDLSTNNFASRIPDWLFNLSSLEYLDLGYNGFQGNIPLAIGNLKKLQVLDLSLNSFNGDILKTLSSLKSLRSIDISENKISGSIPETMGSLKSLRSIDISKNKISGSIPETIGNLKNLESLDFSTNSISGEIPKTIWNLPKLQNLGLYNNNIGGVLLKSIENLHNLQILDLSYNQISGQIPETVENLRNLKQLLLDHNNLSGPLPNQIGDLQSLQYLKLGVNSLSGSIPASLGKLSILLELDLQSNSLVGALIEAHFVNLTSLSYLDLSHNSLTVDVSQSWLPPWFCEANSLYILNLADNDLTGVLPDCWANSSNLEVIDFSGNKLSGGIPSSMGSISELKSLHLENNRLSGKIPLSLKKCKHLVILDLGNNKLSGSIPQWIGESLSSLRVLRLRSNMLDGDIPMQLSLLNSLQVLDLADNNLSGTLPPSFGNFRAMTMIQNESKPLLDEAPYYTENLQISIKGTERNFTTIVLSLVTGIDLSDNNITGEIPKEFTNLQGLRFLNLSGNYLIGRIPNNIGALRQLESLDLSMNNLSGTIPISITALDFLSYLNLSHNNLSGRIPFGNHFQTLNGQSIYSGNQYLCGQPIKKCPGDEPIEGPTVHGEEELEENLNDSEMIWVYVCFAPGFVVGFWGFLSTMMIKRSTRFAYIRFIDKICAWIYMVVALISAKLKSNRNQRCM